MFGDTHQRGFFGDLHRERPHEWWAEPIVSQTQGRSATWRIDAPAPKGEANSGLIRRRAERISQVKADQKARGRYLGGKIPFGFRISDDGQLVPHEAEQEAIREMIALHAQGGR